MKGLLLKDFHLIKNTIYILIIIVISGGLLTYLLSPAIGYLFIPLLLSAISTLLITNTITYDHTSNWSKLSVTLPISKGKIILSKYLSYLITMTFCIFLGFAVIGILLWIDKSLAIKWIHILYILGSSILYPVLAGSLMLPVLLLTNFGEIPNTLVFMLSYGVANIICGRIFPSIKEISLSSTISTLHLMMPLFALLAFCISCCITILILKKKTPLSESSS